MNKEQSGSTVVEFALVLIIFLVGLYNVAGSFSFPASSLSVIGRFVGLTIESVKTFFASSFQQAMTSRGSGAPPTAHEPCIRLPREQPSAVW